MDSGNAPLEQASTAGRTRIAVKEYLDGQKMVAYYLYRLNRGETDPDKGLNQAANRIRATACPEEVHEFERVVTEKRPMLTGPSLSLPSKTL